MGIKTVTEWDAYTNRQGGVIIKFTASWCKVCKEAMDVSHTPGISYYEVDIDDAEEDEELMCELEKELGGGVQKIPLFVSKVNGKVIESYQGKKEENIRLLIDRLVSSVSRITMDTYLDVTDDF